MIERLKSWSWHITTAFLIFSVLVFTAYWRPQRAEAAITVPQHTLSITTTSSANAASFASTPTAGDLVVVCLTFFGGGSDLFSSIGDNQVGNTYTQVGVPLKTSTNNDYLRMYYAKNVAATGTFTVTAHYTGTPGSGDTMLAIYDVKGADTTNPFDKTASSTASASSAVSPGAITPAANGEYVFSCGVDDNGNNATPTANTGAGYALQDHQDDSTNHERIYTESLIQGTAGATTASFTIGANSNWAVRVAAFTAAAAPIASTPVSPIFINEDD